MLRLGRGHLAVSEGAGPGSRHLLRSLRSAGASALAAAPPLSPVAHSLCHTPAASLITSMTPRTSWAPRCWERWWVHMICTCALPACRGLDVCHRHPSMPACSCLRLQIALVYLLRAIPRWRRAVCSGCVDTGAPGWGVLRELLLSANSWHPVTLPPHPRPPAPPACYPSSPALWNDGKQHGRCRSTDGSPAGWSRHRQAALGRGRCPRHQRCRALMLCFASVLQIDGGRAHAPLFLCRSHA